MYLEFKALAAKKQDAVVSKSKVTMVNRLLKEILDILEDEPMKPYLDLLEEDDLPQMSDVGLALSQFCAAMDHFKSKHYGWKDDLMEDAWYIR